MRGCNLTFDPENQAIKGLGTERSTNQAHFLAIKNFNCSHKLFNRRHISDYPLMWLTSLGRGTAPGRWAVPFLV